ncbi:ACT domain-containing ACR2 [Micractinium conductrix]|uniref:ACT domain-containing ACR2 n=1 Tax=Micractinium conductrix TaxID=554055 RepID=A0A2P6VKT8_9CHLO|nr:ACT domain-containing ACR2 [Micractinium conductrix]|eukprot:PSC74677.1 ACT domain-containing ACR2 [Micractinium conductrix]
MSLTFRRVGRSPSSATLALSEWQEKEARNQLQSAVDEDGSLLDNLTLELRVHPPSIEIDNHAHEKWTVVTIDSANRPGSLIYIVQHFTELDLRISSARVSSDGGWFVDVFHLSEANGEKVRNPKKLQSIKQMLNVYMQQQEDLVLNGDDTDDMNRVETTVFELAGPDRAGLLAEVTHLLTHNGCNVRSAAVWTYRGRVAFVLSVTEKGMPVVDGIKLQRLRQLVLGIMTRRPLSNSSGGLRALAAAAAAGSPGSAAAAAAAITVGSPGSSMGSPSSGMGMFTSGGVIVNIRKVRGEIHHDRRLHQLMLQEEINQWAQGLRLRTVDEEGPLGDPSDSCILPPPPLDERPPSQASMGSDGSGPSDSALSIEAAAAAAAAAGGLAAKLGGGAALGGLPPAAAVAYRSPKHDRPFVDIDYSSDCDYWIIAIKCRDRAKLLFDAVCTLADLSYDIYHATIDSMESEGTAQQEFYVRPRTGDSGFDRGQAELLQAMLISSIQRRFPKGLKVHVHSLDRFGCLAALTRVLHQTGLSVTRAKVRTYATSKSSGHTFYVMDANGGPPDKARVEAACREIGGQLVEAGQEARSSSVGSHRFSYSFLQRNWNQNWGGSPGHGLDGMLEASSAPSTPQRRHHGPVRAAAAARRRRRSALTRLLAAALLVAAFTGWSSYHLHVAQHRAGMDEAVVDWSKGGGRHGALAGLRSWLLGVRAAGRRSLREGPPGVVALDLAAPRVDGHRSKHDVGEGAVGVQLYDLWWLLDGYAQLPPPDQQQQQQLEAAEEQQLEAAVEDDGSAPLARLLELPQLQPAAFRVYDFREKSWVRHNITQIPEGAPVARWAVASLLNKPKKRESVLFLAGGYASPAELAAQRAPRAINTDGARGGVTLRAAGDGAATACPLASTAVLSLNTGRHRFRELPPLPEGRFGSTTVVVGARLHVFGGWATPDRAARMAEPARHHWSIGLNADGSSAPEWQEELQLPAELVGRRLTAAALSRDEAGEPGIYVWSDGSTVSEATLRSGEAGCYASGVPLLAAGGAGHAVQLWSYTVSGGWEQRGLLPQPLADDVQCTQVAAPHLLLAVGAAERSGLLTRHRGIWQYDASQRGGTWTRAGWAPVKFAGRQCTMYHGRLFTSSALPQVPPPQPWELVLGTEEAAAAASGGGGGGGMDGAAAAAGAVDATAVQLQQQAAAAEQAAAAAAAAEGTAAAADAAVEVAARLLRTGEGGIDGTGGPGYETLPGSMDWALLAEDLLGPRSTPPPPALRTGPLAFTGGGPAGPPQLLPAAPGSGQPALPRVGSSVHLAARGVSWCKRRCMWEAAISIGGKRERLGFYRQEDAAARAYDRAASWRNAEARRQLAASGGKRRRGGDAAGGDPGDAGAGAQHESPGPTAKRRQLAVLPLNLPDDPPEEAALQEASLQEVLIHIRDAAKCLLKVPQQPAPAAAAAAADPTSATAAAASALASRSAAAAAAVPASYSGAATFWTAFGASGHICGAGSAAAAATAAAVSEEEGQEEARDPGLAAAAALRQARRGGASLRDAAAAAGAAAAAVLHPSPLAKSSRFQGVCQCGATRWQAQVTHKRHRWYLGMHESEDAAAAAYDQGALCLLGAAARTNFPKERYDVAALHALAIEEVAAHLKAQSRAGAASAGAASAGGGGGRKRRRASLAEEDDEDD